MGFVVSKKSPTNIDKHVGQRGLERRSLLGISRNELAQRLGVSYQQVQKYETGTSRLSSTRLYELSNVLEVPIQYFFDGLKKKQRQFTENVLDKRETFDLVRAYWTIGNPKVRKHFISLVESLGNDERA